MAIWLHFPAELRETLRAYSDDPFTPGATATVSHVTVV